MNTPSASALDRRIFLSSVLAAMAMPAACLAAERNAPRRLKITNVEVVVTNPSRSPNQNFVLVKILTNEPEIYGWGDATCTGSEVGVAKFLEEHLKPGLLGQDPLRTENLWQTLYFLPYYRSGSVHMSALSGIDMALWDIKGKVAGLPVYELLGGKTRERLLTYRSTGGRDFKQVQEGVQELKERGYRVIKVQVADPNLKSGYAVPSTKDQQQSDQQAYREGVPPRQVWEPDGYVRLLPRLLDHLRNAFGDTVQFLHDVHERITPSQAIQLAKDVEPYKLFFFEDPLRPEHLDTFRIIRRQTSTPIAMGEAFTALWEGRELITEHLIDYLRHDLAHVGGVTAGKKLATLAEPYGILTAWHGPGNISPISHMANCHVSLSVPNFGIQEYAHGWGEPMREVFSAMPSYSDGHVTIDDSPGLGLDVNEKAAKRFPYQRFLRPAIRRADDTPWPY
ncbi:MAG: D-galactonate dehydratase family protein [Verrucomicrobia bacterium]|nr:D-galactonate dehydratase family protein [Verrucomicrobiota bacterium]